MSMFNKNAFEIISEASKCDSFNTNSIFTDDVTTEFEDLFVNLAEVDEDEIIYPLDSIPVLQCASCKEAAYFVEMDILGKFMSSNGVEDIAEAMQMIADHNEISLDEMAVLVESEDVALELLEEAKKSKKKIGDHKKLTDISNTTNILKLVKTKGIKVAKKKSKKRK